MKDVCVRVCVSSSVLSDALWPMDYSPPGSFVHVILQAKILWVAITFSRGSSQPRDWTQVFGFAGRLFTVWATREAKWDITRAKL